MKLFLMIALLVLPISLNAQSNYFTAVITNDSDDAEEDIDGGGIDLTSSDLEMAYDEGVLGVNSKDQIIGLRFTNIDVPENAIIDSVFLQFTVKSSDNDPAILQIHGEDFFNSPTFADLDYNISSRPRTDSSVYWTVPNWDNEDESGWRQRTPNLNGVMSEIIAQPLWQQGNSITFIIEGSGRRSAFSHDNDSEKATRLHVYYSENTASITQESLESLKAKVFPNPANEELIVDLSTIDSNEPCYLSVFSISGQKITQKPLKVGEKHDIYPLVNHYKGLAIIKVDHNGFHQTFKQIIN
jgi:hypothetical protein